MIILNMSYREVKLPAKLVIACILAANIVPESKAPKPIEEAQPEAEIMYSQDGHSNGYTEAQKPTIQLTQGVPFSNLLYLVPPSSELPLHSGQLILYLTRNFYSTK